MRRTLTWSLTILVVLGGFYVAWPAWTARQIRHAIEANEPAALERRIDFALVRERLKPVLEAEMERSVGRLKERSGTLGAIAGQLKDRVGKHVADAAVDTVLTPGNVIALVRQGKTLRRVLRERIGNRSTDGDAPGGAGSTGEPTAAEQAPRRRLTLANIKSYRITGPLSLTIGVARDAAANEPDIIAELAFTGWDWKVIGLVPQF